MNADIAHDWLKLLVEISVGVYVFYISVPALMYGTLIPQELRDLRSPSNARLLSPSFTQASVCVFIIVVCSFIHFFYTQWRWQGRTPQSISHIMPDGSWITETVEEFNFVSTITVIIVSSIFIVLLLSGYTFMRHCVRIQQGRLQMFMENLTGDIIQYYQPDSVQSSLSNRSWQDRWLRKFSPKKRRASGDYIEKDYWNEMQLLGQYARPGLQKHIWIAYMADIIEHLAEHHRRDNSLKQAVSTLSEVMGSESHVCPYDNIKDTLNIYRMLLGHLKTDLVADELDTFSECLKRIENGLFISFHVAIHKKEVGLLHTIVSTMTLLPNYSGALLKISLIALAHGDYETLNYAFNEIIAEEGDKEMWIQNFWGIYAALYEKGEPYRTIAERKREAADIPPMDTHILQEAYHYHTDHTNFEIAEILFRLMHPADAAG